MTIIKQRTKNNSHSLGDRGSGKQMCLSDR